MKLTKIALAVAGSGLMMVSLNAASLEITSSAATVALTTTVVANTATPSVAAESPARTAYAQADYAKALDLSKQQLEKNAGDAEAHEFYIRALMALNRLEEAEEAIETALEQFPKNARMPFLKANLLATQIEEVSIFSKMSYAKKMRENWKQAVALDPNWEAPRVALLQYYKMAPGIAGGDDDKAQEQAEALEKINPAYGYLARGTILAHDEKDDEAIAELQKGVEKFPQEVELRYHLGLWLVGQEQWQQAFEQFTAMESLEADNINKIRLKSGALYQLGKLASVTGEYLSEGEAALKRYIEGPIHNGMPPKAWAHYRLGLIHEKQDNQELAVAQFKASKSAEPDERLEDLLEEKI